MNEEDEEDPVDVLTSEEEQLLRRLVRIEEAGGSAGTYVNHVRYPRLNPEYIADITGEIYEVSEDYATVEPLLKRLLEGGFVEPTYRDYETGESFPYGQLTSKGRCYFSDREKLEDRHRAEIAEERAYARRQARKAIIVSIAIALVSNVKNIIEGVQFLAQFIPVD